MHAWRAHSRGYVRTEHAEFVADGLRNGFSIGLVPGSLKGKRIFRNYPSAEAAHASVSKAVTARLLANKSIDLGSWGQARRLLDATFDDYFVFPMGAWRRVAIG